MPTCTFFGHRDCPEEIQPLLKKALLCLIEEWGMDTFYVGHQGKFDYFVYQALQEMRNFTLYIPGETWYNFIHRDEWERRPHAR